jgi:hypothetical protein
MSDVHMSLYLYCPYRCVVSKFSNGMHLTKLSFEVFKLVVRFIMTFTLYIPISIQYVIDKRPPE